MTLKHDDMLNWRISLISEVECRIVGTLSSVAAKLGLWTLDSVEVAGLYSPPGTAACQAVIPPHADVNVVRILVLLVSQQ